MTTTPATQASLEILVLSSPRPDVVTGGDALVHVRLPDGIDPGDVTVELNDRDVTPQFGVRSDGRLLGLLPGLTDGENVVVARLGDGRGAELTVTNHPRQGPVFSGPHLEPFIAETEALGLGPSSPPTYEVPPTYEFFYKRAGTAENDALIPYDLESPPPTSDVEVTTTERGEQLPFIVRRERGVINRAIYDIAVLFQPGEDWQWWRPQSAWNGKLLMVFTGGTKLGHRQGIRAVSELIDAQAPTMGDGVFAPGPGGISLTGGDFPLSRGFAVATSTISQVNNPVTSAETAMMVKEHLIKTYGPVRYTLAIGPSGGSMMQHLTSQNYPGLLDGLLPAQALPDMWTVIMNQQSPDVLLLRHYFNQVTSQPWTDDERIAVTGGADPDKYLPNTVSDDPFYWFRSDFGCTAGTAANEESWVYDPDRNPDGVRGALQEYQKQILGTRAPADWGPVEEKIGRGFTNRPIDNVGVQYGLESLKRGDITAEQFVDLNEKVGGIDIDGNWSSARHEADREGLRNLYRSGQVTQGLGLDAVPMVHLHTYDPFDTLHPLIATEVLRARLVKANGHADNLAHYVTVDDTTEWVDSAMGTLDTTKSYAMRRAAFLVLDRWMAAVEADQSDTPLADKVRKAKPSDAQDIYWADSEPGAEAPVDLVLARMVAGAPLSSDIQKAQLKAIDWDDYGPVSFSPDQQRRLRLVFPDGVCDWSQPGVEQQPPAGVWQTYADTVGGRPLGPAPRSHALG